MELTTPRPLGTDCDSRGFDFRGFPIADLAIGSTRGGSGEQRLEICY
jgi:hypothetical protein